MKFTTFLPTSKIEKKTCLIYGVFEKYLISSAYKAYNNKSLTNILKDNDFQARLGQTFLIYSHDQLLLLVGCGRSSPLSVSNFCRIVLTAIRALEFINCKQAICFLSELEIEGYSNKWKCQKIVELTQAATYRFDKFKSEKNPAIALHTLEIFLGNKNLQKNCSKAIKQGEIIGNGVAYTKNLANLPSNLCTPTFLAQQATKLTKQYSSLKVRVLEEKEMKTLGMGALLGVAQGSREEAKLICLEYYGADKKKSPVVLVGKGVTFDTGGNSLKSPDAMIGMKYDMCGAATVLGAIRAVATLKLPLNIVGIIPAVENMPGGKAYKPEDILTSLSGQTIEVINTDAEGRLILADSLTYAEHYNPEVVIDIATLTGGCIIALGSHASGLFSNSQALADDLLTAGIESYDRVWQFPLWEEYQEQIASPFADMVNSGLNAEGHYADAITAACFLSRFTKNYKWAHLDVAGTASVVGGTQIRQATGRPLPLLMQYLINKVNYS